MLTNQKFVFKACMLTRGENMLTTVSESLMDENCWIGEHLCVCYISDIWTNTRCTISCSRSACTYFQTNRSASWVTFFWRGAVLIHVYLPDIGHFYRKPWPAETSCPDSSCFCCCLSVSAVSLHIRPHWQSASYYWECLHAVLLLRMAVMWLDDSPKIMVFWNSHHLKECEAAFGKSLNILLSLF